MSDTTKAINSRSFIISPEIHVLSDSYKAVLFHRRKLTAFRVDKETENLLERFTRPISLEECNPKQLEVCCQLIDYEILVAPNQISHPLHDPVYTNAPHISTYRIIITEHCDLACKYCFVTQGLNHARRMSKDTLENVLKYIVEETKKISEINIHWFGGEPLLAMDLLQWGTERCQELCITNGVSFKHAITTHGGRITDEIASFFKKHQFKVSVSLDGSQETNLLNRYAKLPTDVYASSIQGYYSLLKVGLDAGILLTPAGNNIDRLFENVRFVNEKLGCRRIGINSPQPTKNGWDIKGDKFAFEIARIMHYCASRHIDLSCIGQRIALALTSLAPQGSDCVGGNGELSVSVDPNGEMGYCIVSWFNPSNIQPITSKDAASKAIGWKTAPCRSHITPSI